MSRHGGLHLAGVHGIRLDGHALSGLEGGGVHLGGGAVTGVGAVHGVLDHAGAGDGHGAGALRQAGGGGHIGGGGGHIDAAGLLLQHEGVVVHTALHQVAGDAGRVVVDVQLVELHGIHGGALVLDEEVHAVGHIGAGDPLHPHAAHLAHVALGDGHLAQIVDAHELVAQAEELVHGVGHEQGPVGGGHQGVAHLLIRVEDGVDDGVLGGRGGQTVDEARVGTPLVHPVLVQIGDDHLLGLPLGRPGGALDVHLVALVALVDGHGERLVRPHGHLLHGVAQLGRVAVAAHAAPLIVGQGNGVHAPDLDGAQTGEGVVLAGGGVGQAGLLERLLELVGKGRSQVDRSHLLRPFSRGGRAPRGRPPVSALVPVFGDEGLHVVVLGGAAHGAGGLAPVGRVLPLRRQLLLEPLVLVDRVGCGQGDTALHLRPHLLGDALGVYGGIHPQEGLEVPLLCLPLGLCGLLGLLVPAGLRVQVRLPLVQFRLLAVHGDLLPGGLLVHARCLVLLRRAEVQILRHGHAVALGIALHQGQGGLRLGPVVSQLVPLGLHPVIVPALLAQSDQLVPAHLAGLIPVLEGEQLRGLVCALLLSLLCLGGLRRSAGLLGAGLLLGRGGLRGGGLLPVVPRRVHSGRHGLHVLVHKVLLPGLWSGRASCIYHGLWSGR
nr:MAG TPA: hypothetical protein [Caudoviricetes sp.]